MLIWFIFLLLSGSEANSANNTVFEKHQDTTLDDSNEVPMDAKGW